MIDSLIFIVSLVPLKRFFIINAMFYSFFLICDAFHLLNCLFHFWPIFPFYTSWNRQETFGFLVFSGGIKWEQRLEMVQNHPLLVGISFLIYCLNKEWGGGKKIMYLQLFFSLSGAFYQWFRRSIYIFFISLTLRYFLLAESFPHPHRSLLNYVGCVGSWVAWVAWVAWVENLRGLRGSIKFWGGSKKWRG